MFTLISKERVNVVFDIVINTTEGILYCGYFKRKENENSLTIVIKNQLKRMRNKINRFGT